MGGRGRGCEKREIRQQQRWLSLSYIFFSAESDPLPFLPSRVGAPPTHTHHTHVRAQKTHARNPAPACAVGLKAKTQTKTMSDVKDILGVSRAPGAAGGGGGLTAGAVLPAGTPAAAAAAALAGIDKADQRDRAAGAGAGAAQRPARPAGMSREAFALLDTAHPIAPTAAAAALKAAGVARGAPKHKKGKGGSKKKVKGEGRAEKQKKKKKKCILNPLSPLFLSLFPSSDHVAVAAL